MAGYAMEDALWQLAAGPPTGSEATTLVDASPAVAAWPPLAGPPDEIGEAKNETAQRIAQVSPSRGLAGDVAPPVPPVRRYRAPCWRCRPTLRR